MRRCSSSVLRSRTCSAIQDGPMFGIGLGSGVGGLLRQDFGRTVHQSGGAFANQFVRTLADGGIHRPGQGIERNGCPVGMMHGGKGARAQSGLDHKNGVAELGQ